MESRFIIFLCFGNVLTADWSYEHGHEAGPDNWGKGPGKCNGTNQSPININTTTAEYNEALFYNPLQLFDYDRKIEGEKVVLKNTGYTAQLDITGSDRYIKVGVPRGDYRLLQIHFHWGENKYRGSEHSLDGRFYPLEMHMVHHHEIHNVSQAIVLDDGLAVLGFFFELGEKDNDDFDNIVDNLHKILYKGNSTELPSFAVDKWMPKDRDIYYRYAGGLTTPPCYESVIWTVFHKPIMISERQMNQFRMLMAKEKGAPDQHKIVNNFRPLQKRNYRSIFTSVPKDQIPGVSSSSGLISSALLVALLAVIHHV